MPSYTDLASVAGSRLQRLRNLSLRTTLVTDNPMCKCNQNQQTVDHLIFECKMLHKEREKLKTALTKAGGRWSLDKRDLI